MTDQHTPSQRQSAAPASTAVPGGDGVDTPARPSRSRATKPTVASPARPAAKAARAAPRTATPDGAAARIATSPSSATVSGTDAVPSPPAALTPVARPRAAAKPSAPPRAAAQEAAALPPGTAGSPPSPEPGTTAEAARPSRRAAPDALPEPPEAAEPTPEPDLPRGALPSPDPVEENAPEAAAALADGSEPDPADPEAADLEAGEPNAPAAREDEDEEDDEEEEAPRSNARMPGMGGGMARPGMRPISPQLGGRPTPAPRIPSKAENFVEGDHVVYPTHGVGRVERIATEEIAGHKLELIHITFEENRMTLRVPVAKARSAGLRKLATRKMFDEALAVLRGRARIKRTMWSRRAQEYEAKINSGDPLSIAEVVRDLHRNAGQPDQSFSERQIYEAAMDRLAAELAALDQTEKAVAATKLVDHLKTV